MNTPQPKDLDTISLARKGGDDADLLLLDKIHDVRLSVEDEIATLQGKIDDLKSALPQFADIFKQIELIQGKTGPKGEKGDKGDAGQSIKGDPGRDGTDGRDGKDGRDGIDGIDGVDGEDGQDADDEAIRQQIQALRDEVDQRLSDHEAAIKAIPERPVTTIFGPGKTKLIVLDLSPLLDGVRKTFPIGTNFGIVSVNSSSAPFGAFRPLIDYNGVGKNIVFTDQVDAPSALAAGQSLIITILK